MKALLDRTRAVSLGNEVHDFDEVFSAIGTASGTWGSRAAKEANFDLGACIERARVERERDRQTFFLAISSVLRLLDWVPGNSATSHTFGARSFVAADTDAEEWGVKNRRRHHLIDKEVTGGGLTRGEEEELKQLQADAAAVLKRVAPLPIKALEELAARARETAPKKPQ